MKNLLIILFVFIGINLFSQRVYTDSILITGITGADTTLTIPFKTEMGSSIMFDFTNFDADDAILDFGYSQGTCFSRVDDNRIPIVLSTAVYDYDINGTTKAGILFKDLKWGSKEIMFKLTKTSVTSGTLIWRFVR